MMTQQVSTYGCWDPKLNPTLLLRAGVCCGREFAVPKLNPGLGVGGGIDEGVGAGGGAKDDWN